MEVKIMMNDVIYMNSYDDVIVNYVGNDFEELAGMISNEDVKEMADWLMREFGFDYEDCSKEDVIADYIKEWLCMNIRNNIITGTKELFRLVTEVM
jgi:hypothetical protein